jgi:hypothetical protein
MNEGGLNSKNMCAQFIKAMDYTIDHFVPSPTFNIFTPDAIIGQEQPFNKIGVPIPRFDTSTIEKQINLAFKDRQ